MTTLYLIRSLNFETNKQLKSLKKSVLKCRKLTVLKFLYCVIVSIFDKKKISQNGVYFRKLMTSLDNTSFNLRKNVIGFVTIVFKHIKDHIMPSSCIRLHVITTIKLYRVHKTSIKWFCRSRRGLNSSNVIYDRTLKVSNR